MAKGGGGERLEGRERTEETRSFESGAERAATASSASEARGSPGDGTAPRPKGCRLSLALSCKGEEEEESALPAAVSEISSIASTV